MDSLHKKTLGFDGRHHGGEPAEGSVEEDSRALAAARGRSVGNRAPLLWLVLPFMVGLAVGRLAPLLPAAYPLAVSAACASLSAWVALRRPRTWAAALLAA